MIRILLRGIDYLFFDYARHEHTLTLDKIKEVQEAGGNTDDLPFSIPEDVYRRNPKAQIRSIEAGKYRLKTLIMIGGLLFGVAALLFVALGYIPNSRRVISNAFCMAVFAPPFVLYYAALWLFTWRKRRRITRAVTEHCAACGYDLSDLNDDLSPSPVFADRTGPARCPECGFAWPLLP